MNAFLNEIGFDGFESTMSFVDQPTLIEKFQGFMSQLPLMRGLGLNRDIRGICDVDMVTEPGLVCARQVKVNSPAIRQVDATSTVITKRDHFSSIECRWKCSYR